MIFLVIVLALLVLQWGSARPLQRDGWYLSWRQQVPQLPLPGLRLLLWVGVPVLLVVLLDWGLRSVWYGLPLFVLYLLVLLYSMGRGDLKVSLEHYLDAWQRGDTQAAGELAAPLGVDVEDAAIDSEPALHEHVRRAVLYRGLERWFVVVFWFCLLGPAAALAYRLLALALDSAEERSLAARCIWLLEWVPVRLLGLAFAITGSFVDCFRQWQRSLARGGDSAEWLARYQRAALLVAPFDDGEAAGFRQQAADELRETSALLTRSVVCWLLVLAALQFL